MTHRNSSGSDPCAESTLLSRSVESDRILTTVQRTVCRPVCDHIVPPLEGEILLSESEANMSEVTPRQGVLLRTPDSRPVLKFLPDFRDFWQHLLLSKSCRDFRQNFRGGVSAERIKGFVFSAERRVKNESQHQKSITAKRLCRLSPGRLQTVRTGEPG